MRETKILKTHIKRRGQSPQYLMYCLSEWENARKANLQVLREAILCIYQLLSKRLRLRLMFDDCKNMWKFHLALLEYSWDTTDGKDMSASVKYYLKRSHFETSMTYLNELMIYIFGKFHLKLGPFKFNQIFIFIGEKLSNALAEYIDCYVLSACARYDCSCRF